MTLWWFRRVRREGIPRPDLQALVTSLVTEGAARRSIEILEHENVPAPLTFGAWRPVIVLPRDARDWNEADLQRALVHELEHIRRGDWVVQLIARAVCACYWFHPLVWAAWRQLCLEAERACDDAVIEKAERTEYAEQLVSLAQRLSATYALPTLGMANRSDLSTRVTAVLDDGQRRGRTPAWAAAGVVCIASLVVLIIAPVRAVATSINADAQAASPGAARPRHLAALDVALVEAAEGGDLAGVDELLHAGAEVNGAVDGDGSPLIAAARAGRLAVVRRLLDRGADPNMPVPGDGNPLIMAAGAGFADVVALLLDRGANVDQIVPGDENALIQASGSGHLRVVRLLVERGADVNARVWVERTFNRSNGEWRTPLNMARKGGHTAVVEFLRAAGAQQ